MFEARIGIDLGGTKIEGVCIDSRGIERARQRISTPQARGYEAIIAAIVDLVRELESTVGQRASVGIGTPGSPSPSSGLQRNSNTVCLNGRALKTDLELALGQPIRLANDADCFALSEATDGAGAGASSVFGVIVGTGTGGGLVVGGRLLAGANGIAGEWGHNPLPWPTDEELPGPTCYCGKTGCIETWLSGPGLAADHERHGGTRRPAGDIARAALLGDPAAEEAMERHAQRFARALASVINIVDPEVIVLGGGLSRVGTLYTRLPELVTQWIFSDVFRTRILPARHGDASGVRGAAWLWG